MRINGQLEESKARGAAAPQLPVTMRCSTIYCILYYNKRAATGRANIDYLSKKMLKIVNIFAK